MTIEPKTRLLSFTKRKSQTLQADRRTFVFAYLLYNPLTQVLYFLADVIIIILQLLWTIVTAGNYKDYTKERFVKWIIGILCVLCLISAGIRHSGMIEDDPSLDSTLNIINICLYVLVMLMSLYLIVDEGIETDHVTNFISLCILGALFGVVLFTKFDEPAMYIGIISTIIGALLLYHAVNKNMYNNEKFIITKSKTPEELKDLIQSYLNDIIVIKDRGKMGEQNLSNIEIMLKQYLSRVNNRNYKGGMNLYNKIQKEFSKAILGQGGLKEIELKTLQGEGFLNKVLSTKP